MSRTAKIAAAGALGGLLMTLTVAMTMREERRVETIIVPANQSVTDPLADDLRRCRTLTMPDSGCEAAWEERRRRFYAREEQP
ncbi:putative entry exclusion protein TrbK-alt [Sphingobium sp. Sx8-8]|uniref:putative entry exclusion protein TrbK-alt n=1 Tax=Sphingobium sp. Sx8-8 TaxID=2933617 RepID=UPI001F5857FA|nr:putative entry exclusion protein TrbK-alt [Sphingobium sp. Sx8-8]